ncbi:hypothetical protein AVEN_1355-1 [Araneus ventricosus]|uniref:Uncharacterized protein n=1 Tax=Araneus ventricosus TaxID=182803 RepID=A0A4Y2D503_ARAVE|nr:hypothetical protein AVEN_1355-1 [Araneus ventricosus]
MDVGSISDERETVLRQHCRGQILLVPFFHVGHVLTKTFAVLITTSSYQGRNSSGSPESGSLRTYCSRNPEIKKTYTQPDPCSFRPRNSLESLLRLARTHPKLVLLYIKKFLKLGALKSCLI